MEKKASETGTATQTGAAGDVENQNQNQNQNQIPAVEGLGVSQVLRRWKREDLLKKGTLGLRALALLFSFLAFVIMAANQHGDWQQFHKYEEYRYVLAVAFLSSLYTAMQVFRQVHEFCEGKEPFSRRTVAWLDFSGDQIVAYMLISASSSAVPLTNRMREGRDNIFTDSTASSISMSFLAFLAIAMAALISGYKLSNQSYI